MMIWAESESGTEQAAVRKVTVSVAHMRALLDEIEVHMRAAKGFSVATLNLDHVVKLRKSPAFRTAYLAHSHVTADGNPIVWLSRLAGQDVSLVCGSDLVEPVSRIAAATGVPVALLGSTREALDAAAAELQSRVPGLDIVARIAPPMGFDPTGTEAESLIAELGASGARLCLLALGAPKQEIFAAHAQARLPQVGFLSIGAGLDFLAGRQTRAPKVMRLLAAEWMWRLAGNPRRLAGRYAACIAVLPELFVRALRVRLYQGPHRGDQTT